MRILVYGAGVLGCNLANNLYHAKKDVTLLARGAWAKQLKQNGLHMKKTFHLRESVSRVPVITQLESNDCYDVIFVMVRYTQRITNSFICNPLDALHYRISIPFFSLRTSSSTFANHAVKSCGHSDIQCFSSEKVTHRSCAISSGSGYRLRRCAFTNRKKT